MSKTQNIGQTKQVAASRRELVSDLLQRINQLADAVREDRVSDAQAREILLHIDHQLVRPLLDGPKP